MIASGRIRFGYKDFASIYSIVICVGIIGYGVGTPFYGMVFDKTGSYLPAIYICVGIAVIAGALVTVSLKLSGKLARD